MSLSFVLGVEALVLFVMLWLLAPAVLRRRPGLSFPMLVARVATGAAAFAFLLNAVTTDRPAGSGLANPVPATVVSVSAGRTVFQARCAACHGVDARGGGPAAGTTAVRPPDLRAGHLAGHSDGEIFTWITNGLPGGMPAWADSLSETDRWNLVDYLRSINGAGPTAEP